MRTVIRPLVFGVFAMVLVACGTSSSPSSPDSGSGESAATVNGQDIPRSQVVQALDELADLIDGLPAEDRDNAIEGQQREVLSLLIQNAIISQAVEGEGVEVTAEDETTARDEILASIGGEEMLDDTLAQAGLTRSLFEDAIVPQQARVVALARELSGGETLETRTVRHVLVETEEEGDDVVARLEAGEDFGEVAQDVSIDGTGQTGGELPPSPRGAFVPEFDEATWSAELNEIVGPVESQFGFHILEVLAEDTTDASDLDIQQLMEMAGPQLDEVISTAFDAAEVEVDAAFGEWDPDQRTVVPVGQVGQAPEMPVDPGMPGGGDMTPEEMEEFQRELERQLQEQGAPGGE